jgi:hypothetical protein
MSDDGQYDYQAPTPNPDLQSLNRLVGRWRVGGGVEGTVRYEWMDGGFFMLQTYDFMHSGHQVKGIEVIGHTQAFGGAPSRDIISRIYDNTGNTFDYVYEIVDDTLTIWAGEKGSPAYYRGTFDAEGNIPDGAWVYPDGGGYQSSMTRIK